MARETRSPDCLVEVQQLLTDLACKFLETGFHELDVAIFDGAWLFDPGLDSAIIEAVDRFSCDLSEKTVNVLRLICAAIRIRELTGASDRLVALVHLAHAFDQRAGGRSRFGELAKDAVFALLQIAPKLILDFDPDLRPVRTVLAQWCHQSRSLVFADRIIDSAGRIVAQREQSSLPDSSDAVRMTPGDVRQLVETSLTVDDFMNLCFDHYLEVHRQFTEQQTRAFQIRLLVEFATTRNRLSELVQRVREKNSTA